MRTNSRTARRLRPILAIGLAYLLLASWAYLPLATDLASAIPGYSDHPDYASFYWNIWWFQHALFRLQIDPFFTDYIFYPYTLNLAYHTLSPFLNLIALPVYATLGLTTAFNSLIFASLAFSGLAMYAFLRHQGLAQGLAFAAGALFTFSSFTAARVSHGQLNMIPVGWLPLALLAWERMVRRRTRGSILGLSAVLYLALMTDVQFAMWIALVMGPYVLFRLFQSERRSRGPILARTALAAAAWMALTLVAPLPQTLAGRDAGFPVTGLREASARSLPVIDLFSVPPRFTDSGRATLGWLVPLLAGTSVIRGKSAPRRFFWLGLGVLCVVLALGPTLQPHDIPLPYQLIHQAFGGLYRSPDRFVLPAGFALITFAVLSLHAFYTRLPRPARMALIAGVLLLLAFENRWNEPFPIFRMPDYRIYHAIGSEPGDALILEVPVGMRNSVADPFGRGIELQYYASVHHKRLINGSVSRAPAGISGSYRKWPLITALAGEGPVPEVAAARSEFERLRAEWDIRYVVVHREMLSADLATWAIGFFNTQPGWCLVDEEGPLLAYRRDDSGQCADRSLLDLPANGVINLGDGGDDRHIGPGWYSAENVGGPQARWMGGMPTATFQVRLARQTYRVTVRATAYPSGEVMSIAANGRVVASSSVGAGWGEYEFELPAEMIPADGVVTLTLSATRAESAYDRTGGQAADQRPLAVAVDAIAFQPGEVRSDTDGSGFAFLSPKSTRSRSFWPRRPA